MPLVTNSPFRINPSTPWDLGNATLAASYNFSEDTNMRGMAFKPDGTKMYLSGGIGSRVYAYTLSTPWLVSSATYDGEPASKLISGQDSSPFEIGFNTAGNKMFMYGAGSDAVYQYTLSTAWLASSATYDTVSWGATGEDLDPTGMTFKPDGSKLYLSGNFSNSIYQYSLPTPWDLTVVNYDSKFKLVSGEDFTPYGTAFSSDGETMLMLGAGNDTVYQYAVSTAWDVGFASYSSISKLIPDTNPSSVEFSADGSKMYVLGLTNSTVYQYSL